MEWLGSFSLWWAGLWLIGLLLLFIGAWLKWISLEFATERKLRDFFGAFVILFAILTVCRVASAVYYSMAKEDFFRRELIGYTVFWLFFPPMWFFLEYYAIDTGVVRLPPKTNLKDTLEGIKIYADFASKVWAAVLAGLAGLIALVSK
jgi:hypothetical protein